MYKHNKQHAGTFTSRRQCTFACVAACMQARWSRRVKDYWIYTVTLESYKRRYRHYGGDPYNIINWHHNKRP